MRRTGTRRPVLRRPEEQRPYFASLIVARGLATCSCAECQEVKAYAKRWEEEQDR